MSQKQLTCLLVLCILLLGNTATFSALPGGKRTAQPLATSNPSASLFGQDDSRPRLVEKLQREVATETVDLTGAILTKSYVPTFICSDQDNTDLLSPWVGLSFRNSGAMTSLVSAIGNKYFVQQGFLCSLSGTWMFLGAIEGDIDAEIGVWAGVGPSSSVPSTQVASVIVNSLTLTANSWNFFDLSGLGLTFTEDFFISFGAVLGSAVDAGGPETDRIQAMLDNSDGSAVSTRTGITFDALFPGWTQNNLFWNQYYNQVASAIVCCQEIPFTNCLVKTNADSYSVVYSLPSTVNCRKGVAMRYTTGGFDTLLVAEIYLTDFFSGTDPDGEVVLEILADNGSGAPDASSPLAPPLTIGGIGLGGDLYPLGSFGWVDYPINIVPGPSVTYHIAVRWTGPDPSVTGFGSGIGADDFASGEGNIQNVASVFFPDGVIDAPYASCVPTLTGWNNYFTAFGSNPDFLIDINVCSDEFIDCELLSNAGNLTLFSTFLASEGFTGFSGSYAAGGDECRVDIARIPIFGYDDLDGMEVGIYVDAAGVPGVAAYSEIVPQSSFPYGPGLNQGVAFIEIFPNAGAGVQIMGPYHVVARPLWGSASPDPAYQILVSDGSDPVAGHYEIGGAWVPSDAVFTNGNNFYTESFRCCVPIGPIGCGPGDDWPTYQHDQQRTGASYSSLGQANCNLNLLWSVTSDAGNSFSGSVIFGDKVLISDDAGVDCRLLSDGSLVWDQDTDPTISGLFAGALSNRTQPTVATITIGGGPAQVAFLGTGLNRDVVAVSAQTGAYIWHITSNFPFSGLFPNATNVKSIVLNDGVDDILYFAAQNKLFAVTAKDGAPYAGWTTNPVVMGADNVNALTTDIIGSQIVSPTFSGAVEGNVYSLNAATGALNWTLSSIGGGGLQASRDARSGYAGNEGFFSGASYDSQHDVFWVNSYFDADFPAEGYLYRIAADGSVFTTAKSVRSRRATPIIDINQIYVPAFTKWANPIYSGEQVFARVTGAFLHSMEGRQLGDRQFNDGVLTCEGNTDNYYIHGTELGELNFYQVGLINSLQFYRETTLSGFVGGQWAGGALSPDALVFTTLGGLTVALGSGANRPRLTLPTTRQDLPIPFGTPNGFDATFPAVIGNSGCFDLIINGITFTDPAPPLGVPIEFSAVDPVLRLKMKEQADFITNSRLFEKMGLMYGAAPAGFGPYQTFETDKTPKSSLNYRAAVLPDVIDGTTGAAGLISPSAGDAISPGSVADLHVAINGPLVTRGPHDFIAHIDTNDPDYFLDNPSAIPTVALRVIGGCLEDSVVLTFGIGGANSAVVFNDALVQRFANDGNHSLNIDGFDTGTEFFAGIRGWSLTPHRLAWTGSAWDFVGGWNTILADRNYCSNTCIPTLQSNVLLGSISNDGGASYTNVFGDLVGLTYIDSARDYTGGGGVWDWQSNPDDFLPDSTIGIMVNETHYGAHDVPGLANFDLMRLDVTNRSAIESITDLQHFAVHDDDISGSDNMLGAAAFGYIYGETNSSKSIHGYGVVGYGCDVAPSFRGRDAEGGKFMFQTGVSDTAQAFDSIYVWGRDPAFAGITSQDVFSPYPNATDGESYYNFGGVDLAPGETKTIGLFHFAFSGTSAPAVYDGDKFNSGQFQGLADMANKWAGFGRGDVNNDRVIDLADVVYLAGSVGGGDGPFPFAHLGDVNNDGAVDATDVAYMIDFYFNCGPCPVDDWTLALCAQ